MHLFASDTAPQTTSTVHEHGWQTESSHASSEGVVSYVRCVDCGTRRVDLHRHDSTPATAISRGVGGLE